MHKAAAKLTLCIGRFGRNDANYSFNLPDWMYPEGRQQMIRRSAVEFLPRTTGILTVFLTLFFVAAFPSKAEQTTSSSATDRPSVEINLDAINGTGAVSASEATAQTTKRIVDGREVIILTPPSLQEKEVAEKIALPRKRPPEVILAVDTPEAVAAKEDKVSVAEPIEAEIKSPLDETKVAAIDVITSATIAPLVEEKTLPTPAPKVEAVVEPAADKKTPIPSAEDLAATKKDIAETAASKITEQKEEIQIAAVDPQKEIEDAAKEAVSTNDKLEEGQILSLQYSAGEVDLPETADEKIQSIYEQLSTDQRTVQLIAYATANNNSAARRLSLGRALAVRSKLLELGMSNKQIEVRALGSPQGEDPSDRLDLVLIAR
ncbi:MAG: OmpA family protein [Proteobacteria bacterium]|nr:OmpA family protein [Pseudomonadota bacterium]